nr:hypothetical protein [uncultured bacterium]
MTYSSTSVVPSALMGLTALFGMVRGEPHCNNHLRVICLLKNSLENTFQHQLNNKLTY